MKFDVAILGGGLAGLAFSIDLKMRGYSVVVIEKGSYPRHKVCGEYISMESYNYLYHLCPALASLNLPQITNFKLSSTSNRQFHTKLDLGGFGISRYVLENLLFLDAKKSGVVFMLKCKALNVQYNDVNEEYDIETSDKNVNSYLVCNSTGRKSSFETKQKETTISGANYIGIKYHIKIERDPSFVEIHNFPGGYCGLSAIEENKSCLCYLVNAKHLKNVNSSIPELQRKYLYQNNHLQKIFNTAEFVFKEPFTISGINFNIKKPVNDGVFYLGDSAGCIAPVTGNGMSMALRSAARLAETVDYYFLKLLTKRQLVEIYSCFWKDEFSSRVKLSRHFQKLSEYPILTNLSIGLFKPFPYLAKKIINYTHGVPF